MARWFRLVKNVDVQRAGNCKSGAIIRVRLGALEMSPDDPRAKEYILSEKTGVNPDDFGGGDHSLNW